MRTDSSSFPNENKKKGKDVQYYVRMAFMARCRRRRRRRRST